MVNWVDSFASWGWLIFVFFGFTLLITAIYFRQQSRRLKRAVAELYNLNDACEQDALNFFDAAWPQLQSVGCLGLSGEIEWFGENRYVSFGQELSRDNYTRDCSITVDDMSFSIVVQLTREACQSDSIANLVLTTFTHILEQDLILKKAEILTSQRHLERYQLFVQHEIKNISQFIQLLAEQVAIANNDEQKLKLITRVQETLPLMAKRARRTIEQMQQPLTELLKYESIKLEELLQEIINMYELNAEVIGQANTALPRELLAEVFKNILGNYRDHELNEGKIRINIEPNEFNYLNVVIQNKAKCLEHVQPERMFEPFWTSSENGMGLGLFLARELLKQVDAKVEYRCEKQENTSFFVVKLPSEEKK